MGNLLNAITSMDTDVKRQRSIVVDGRHSHPIRHRAPIFTIAEKAGLRVRIVHLSASYKTCQIRNKERGKEKASGFEFSAYEQYFVAPSILEGACEIVTVA
jgi:hypothetical protein